MQKSSTVKLGTGSMSINSPATTSAELENTNKILQGCFPLIRYWEQPSWNTCNSHH